MNRLLLDVHGTCVAVDADDERITDDLGRRLEYFRRPLGSTAPEVLTFSFANRRASELPSVARAGGRTIYEPVAGEMLYFEEVDELYVGLSELRLRMRPAEGDALISLVPEAEPIWLATHSIFALCLTEALKRRGLFSLHAASLEIDGAGLLLVGPNGVGKSTLALALLPRASGFQGDDLVFLTERSDAMQVLPFPDHVGVTEATAALLPAVGRRIDRTAGLPDGARKHEIAAGAPVPARLAPRTLVFVEPAASFEGYRISPVRGVEALAALAPNVLATEATSSQRHLDALAALVRSCRCHRLVGRGDPAEAVELLIRAAVEAR